MILFSWQFWFGVITVIILFLWVLFGGKDHEFVGLKPLRSDWSMKENMNHLGPADIEEVKGLYKEMKIDTTEQEESESSDPEDDGDEDIDGEDIVSTEEPEEEGMEGEEGPEGSGEDSNDSNDSNEDQEESIDTDPGEDQQEEEEPLDRQELQEPSDRQDPPQGLRAISGFKQMSHGQMMCKKCLETWFKVPFESIRPNFLKNPETKQNLELDCFNPDFRVAAEYNGIQHYQFPNKYNRTKEEFLRGIQRDNFKREMCNANGVHLIIVPYKIKVADIPKFLKDRLPVHLRALADVRAIKMN